MMKKSLLITCGLLVLVPSLALAAGCTLKANREGIPALAQATIDSVSNDIVAGQYEKIYDGAAEEWRRTSTPEQSTTFFNALKTKLGNIKNRSFHSAREEHSTSGPVPGHSFVITYRTTFERAEGMETFTLIERDGRWLLAGYFVNSDALKQ